MCSYNSSTMLTSNCSKLYSSTNKSQNMFTWHSAILSSKNHYPRSYLRVLQTTVEVTCFLHDKLESSKTRHYQRHVVILFYTIIMFLNSETTLFYLERERREENEKGTPQSALACRYKPAILVKKSHADKISVATQVVSSLIMPSQILFQKPSHNL